MWPVFWTSDDPYLGLAVQAGPGLNRGIFYHPFAFGTGYAPPSPPFSSLPKSPGIYPVSIFH